MKLHKNQPIKTIPDVGIILFWYKFCELEYIYKHKKLHDSCIEYSRQCFENSGTYRRCILEIWESNVET